MREAGSGFSEWVWNAGSAKTERRSGMTLGAVVLLGLVVAEVVTIVKVSKQGKRIKDLEKKDSK